MSGYFYEDVVLRKKEKAGDKKEEGKERGSPIKR